MKSTKNGRKYTAWIVGMAAGCALYVLANVLNWKQGVDASALLVFFRDITRDFIFGNAALGGLRAIGGGVSEFRRSRGSDNGCGDVHGGRDD